MLFKDQWVQLQNILWCFITVQLKSLQGNLAECFDTAVPSLLPYSLLAPPSSCPPIPIPCPSLAEHAAHVPIPKSSSNLHSPSNYQPISLLSLITEYRYLGVITTSSLSWSKHIIITDYLNSSPPSWTPLLTVLQAHWHLLLPSALYFSCPLTTRDTASFCGTPVLLIFPRRYGPQSSRQGIVSLLIGTILWSWPSQGRCEYYQWCQPVKDKWLQHKHVQRRPGVACMQSWYPWENSNVEGATTLCLQNLRQGLVIWLPFTALKT